MGLKDDDCYDACPESQGGSEQEKLQRERDLNQAITDVQRYAARAEAAEKERDALFQRVQELEGAGRAACEVWERVPNASLHEIRETMKLLRKAVDARLPSDQPEGESLIPACSKFDGSPRSNYSHCQGKARS